MQRNEASYASGHSVEQTQVWNEGFPPVGIVDTWGRVGCGYLLICEIWTKLPPFASEGFWRGLTYSLAMQGHCIPQRAARNTSQEQRRVADSYNESVQGTDHIYRRLNLVVNLGNEVAVFPNFPFNQNHRSYGRNWSQIKGNSQLDAVVHFMYNISLRSLRNVLEETCRWHAQVQILSVALNTLGMHFSPFKVHTYVCSSNMHLIMFYKTI